MFGYENLMIFLALVPGIVFMIYLYKKDRVESEPLYLLLLMLFAGGLAVVVTLPLEFLAQDLFASSFGFDNILFHIADAFIGTALVEEGCKYVFMKLFSWRNRNFNCTFDGVIYAAFASIGFAMIENVFYVLDSGFTTAIYRAFTAVPAHVSFSILMGIFYGQAKKMEAYGHYFYSRILLLLAVILPTLLHGIYDFCLFVSSDLLMIVWYGVLISIYFIVFRVVTDKSNTDEQFY